MGQRLVLHIVMKGQSNRPGTHAFPILTPTPQENGAQMFATGLQTWESRNHPNDPEKRPTPAFEVVPFVDRPGDTRGVPTGQTMANGFANMWQALDVDAKASGAGREDVLLFFTYADEGGTKRTEMNEDEDRSNPLNAHYKKGRTGGHHATTFDDVARAHEIFSAGGDRHVVGKVAWEQGNADNDRRLFRRRPPTPRLKPADFYEQYAAMAERDRETYDKGLSAITGQTTPIPMTEWAMDAPHVVEALIRASAASDQHMLLGPTYQYAGARKSPLPGGDLYGTADHETPDDQLLKGEWEALHFWNWYRNGIPFNHLYPSRGILNAARDRFSLYFEGDDLPVAVDITTFGKIEGYGVQLFDPDMPGALKNAYLPSFYEIWSADRIDLLFSEPVPPTYSHWN